MEMPPSMVQASSSRGYSSINGKRKFFSMGIPEMITVKLIIKGVL